MNLYLQMHLINLEVYDAASSYDIILAEFLPRVEQHIAKMREKTITEEKALDSLFSVQKEKFRELFDFIQKLSDVWTNHTTELEKGAKELMV